MTGFLKQTLPQLFDRLSSDIVSASELPDVEVVGITADSREVRPGYIFVAVQGDHSDGHRFIPQAISQGVLAVVGSAAMDDLVAPYVQVKDPRRALAFLAAAFYREPARSMTMIGVTGTDGKTTTSNLIYQILQSAGVATGIISTVNAQIGAEAYDTGFHVTTPQSPDVQRYLSRMKVAGLTHVVLEVTSHGLAQQRVAACDFEIGVVTNITHEHLDYHGSYENYRATKASLFTGLAHTQPKERMVEPVAVLNKDDQSYPYLHEQVSVRQVCYSIQDSTADVWADEIRHTAEGLFFTAHGPGFSTPVFSHLTGNFNVSNILAALGATVVALGVDAQAAVQGIASLPGVPGRMEQIVMGQNFIAMVDFAHTPNALKQALLAAREMTSGRVISVFGSAGLRDREKRRMMAETSTQLADISILTAEDPRTESLDGILEEMAQGAISQGGIEGQTFYRVADRRDALRKALSLAQPGDLVAAFGKGHEQSMCFGETEFAWDDRTALRAALAELLGVAGPEMPFLPDQEKG